MHIFNLLIFVMFPGSIPTISKKSKSLKITGGVVRFLDISRIGSFARGFGAGPRPQLPEAQQGPQAPAGVKGWSPVASLSP